MIRLEFRKQHRSILSFPTTEIDADFIVLTGINGAGKTHLLEAIENGSVAIAGIPHGDLRIRLFHHTNMQPQDTQAANPTNLWNQRGTLWRDLQSRIESHQSQIRTNLISKGIPSDVLEHFEPVTRWTVSEIETLLDGDTPRATQIHQQLQEWIKKADQEIWSPWKRNRQQVALAEAIESQAGAAVGITEERFNALLPLNWNPTDVFQQNFAQLFSTYHRLCEQNKIDQYYATQENEERTWLSKEEFLKKYDAPPWKIVNDILETAHLPLRVNAPSGPFDQPFELRLHHTELNCDVRYGELSAGEKIIISLAHCLYYAQSGGPSLALPQVLLLDEPDAPLHPTMAKSFMEVIDTVLVKHHGVKVIITTHSPSTVAFAPEGSVYRLDRTPRGLVQSSADSAINILTDGFATVMPSSRFVIVEAAFDQDAYQQLFNHIQQSSLFEGKPPLVFVRASDIDNRTGGGKSQVSSWAQKLSTSGLAFFRGLVDHDKGNEESDVVRVLGRYSIENYLLDPVAIYACLVEQNAHREVLDLPELESCNVHLIPGFDNKKLQTIVDSVCAKLQEARPQLESSTTFKVEYCGGNRVNMPIWLREERGHDLAHLVRNHFRKGESFVFSRNLDELVLMLSSKLPQFISSDLGQIFVDLAS